MKFFNLIILLSILVFSSCKDDDDTEVVDFGTAPSAAIITEGSVEVITEDNVRYHTIIFNGSNATTTTIVETETGAVFIDLANAPNDTESELRAYADSIGKPLDIIITHAHIDHFRNIASFADVPVYAETATSTALASHPFFTANYTSSVNAVATTQTIAGTVFTFANTDNAETADNGYIQIESFQAFFPGDLLYNKAHNYLAEYTPKDSIDELSNWLAALNTIKASFGSYNHAFVGHNGFRNDVSTLIDENIAYLTDAQGLIKGTKELAAGGFATTNQEVVDELAALYPDYLDGALYFSLASEFFPEADWF